MNRSQFFHGCNAFCNLCRTTLFWCVGLLFALCLTPVLFAHADSSTTTILPGTEETLGSTLDDPTPDQIPHAIVLPLSPHENPWEEPQPGFEIARFPAISAYGREMDIMVVRVDPARFDFVVRTATTPGEQPRTLQDWAAKHNLTATINAGMYLPDGLTNTGYLRVGEHLNNPRLVQSFGAFLLAEPLNQDLPSVQLVDRSDPQWEALLPKYGSVVQNYRMVSASRRLLWRPSPQEHAISAISRDGAGRILLLHCREPVTGVDFASMVLDLPVDARTVMYLEGGTQAGLYLRPGGPQLRMGRHPADFWTDGSVRQLLPNVIGIKPKVF